MVHGISWLRHKKERVKCVKYELSDQVRNNILVFLDRTEYKGRKEAVAVVEIEQALSNPIEEDGEGNDTGKNQ